MNALDGLRVLHLSRAVPGHCCAMILSDHGADVLAIEQVGYSIRAKEAVARPRRGLATNRNQKSMTLNLKSDEGKAIFYRLARSADVVLEGYRPGVSERLGVDYRTLEALNPRIIYCAMSGWGQDGPYRNLVGHDINFISIAGILGLTGRENESPVIPGMVMADMGAALHAAVGILLALVSRERTNVGQFVDISYLDGVVSWLTLFADRYFRSGTTCQRGNVETAGANPYYNVYRTKDGEYVSLGCIEPGFWENLCGALGRKDFIPYQRSQGAKKEEIFASLEQIFLTKTRDEWVALLRDSGVDIPCAPVNSFEEALRDPQVTHRMVREADCADKGGQKYLESAIKLSKTPARFTTPPPMRGEHTAEVLLGLGYDSDDIARFSQTGVTE